MSIEREILDANDSFYQAFNRGDLDLMKSVWSQTDSVSCIHPGWEVLCGFATIIESWKKIFVGSENLEIKLSEIKVIGNGEMVWVSCQENLFCHVHVRRSGFQSTRNEPV